MQDNPEGGELDSADDVRGAEKEFSIRGQKKAVTVQSSLPQSHASFVFLLMQDKRKNSSCSTRGHQLLGFNSYPSGLSGIWIFSARYFWLYLPSLIYAPDIGVCSDCWASVEFLYAPIPRKGSGSTTTITLSLRH